MAPRLLTFNNNLRNETMNSERYASPLALTSNRSARPPAASTNLLERHALTFARLHAENPRLADLIEDITQRYLAEELAWKVNR